MCSPVSPTTVAVLFKRCSFVHANEMIGAFGNPQARRLLRSRRVGWRWAATSNPCRPQQRLPRLRCNSSGSRRISCVASRAQLPSNFITAHASLLDGRAVEGGHFGHLLPNQWSNVIKVNRRHTNHFFKSRLESATDEMNFELAPSCGRNGNKIPQSKPKLNPA